MQWWHIQRRIQTAYHAKGLPYDSTKGLEQSGGLRKYAYGCFLK